MTAKHVGHRIVRPRLACACCERFVQAQLPTRPIERGRPSGPVRHVLVSKYADHLPLYRQSQIFERDGLDLDRSTLADGSESYRVAGAAGRRLRLAMTPAMIP